MMNASVHTNMTAQVGVRLEPSRRHSLWPGTAPSREKAKVIREALVTHAIPQNSCPTVAITRTALAAAELSADSMIDCEVPPAELMAFTWVAAKVSASNT